MPSHDAIDFDRTFAALTPRLLRIARKFFADPDDARDVVQDAMVAALQAVDRYEGRAALSTWLHRIVVNTALMELRRRTRQSRWLDREVEVDAATDHRDPGAIPVDDRLAASERSAWLHASLAALPPRHREIVRLRDLEDCSVDETAAVLGITPAAVRVRLHRAHRALHAALVPPVAEATPAAA